MKKLVILILAVAVIATGIHLYFKNSKKIDTSPIEVLSQTKQATAFENQNTVSALQSGTAAHNQCSTLDTLVKQYEIKQNYKNKVIELANGLIGPNSENSDKAFQEQMAQYSGWDLITWRRIRDQQILPRRSLKIVEGSPILLANEKTLNEVFNSAFYTSNYKQLASLMDTGILSKNHAVLEDSIISALIKKDGDIPREGLSQLIQSGFAPMFVDLVTATEENAPIRLIEDLLLYYSGDTSQSWEDNFKSNTLVTIAAGNLNIELFDFWLSRDVPFAPADNHLNALDSLPAPRDEKGYQALQYIIQYAVQNNIYPHNINTLKRIKNWLNEQEQLAYEGYFAQYKQYQIERSSTPMSDIVKAHQNLESIGEQIRRCSPETYQKMLQKQEQSILAKVPAVYQSQETSLVDKGLDEYQKSMIEYYRGVKSPINDILKLTKLAEGEHWEKLLITSENLEAEFGQEHMHYFTLHNLVKNNAPAKYIDIALSSNLALPNDLLLSAIEAGNLETIKHLEKYGLRYDTFKYEFKTDTLHEDENNTRNEMIDYLKMKFTEN